MGHIGFSSHATLPVLVNLFLRLCHPLDECASIIIQYKGLGLNRQDKKIIDLVAKGWDINTLLVHLLWKYINEIRNFGLLLSWLETFVLCSALFGVACMIKKTKKEVIGE